MRVVWLACFIIFGAIWYKEYQSLRGFMDHSVLKTLPVASNALKLSSNSYIPVDELLIKPTRELNPKFVRENATLLMLCRNWELEEVLQSMRSLEDRFNSRYHYTWTFLNDVPFEKQFIQETTLMASGKTQYALISSADWNRPSFINETRFEQNLIQSEKDDIIYGGSPSYRNMCRFNSGFFYKQKILDQYDYYFRVEPGVEYFCDLEEDPFRYMRLHNKKYGFVISIYEYENTIPTLWQTVEKFIESYPEYIHPNNSYEFLTDKEVVGPLGLVALSEQTYNLCHFWSNFEIGDLNFFRSEQYEAFFQFLDQTGGFYYERWGDAPVHSIAVGILLDKSQIHHFENIGYYHLPFRTCPQPYWTYKCNRCMCKRNASIDLVPHSCLSKWWKYGGKTFLH
ncbi:BA75_01977T0 [Komagataella pastoris]|uniref:BA75_01977T0 n=1 Tax=Komagataella pastoris TaxID=4922 RepID=A0A1B2JE14_PICPA|nr:BA75_01977T0 [Komagataella pastoris]